jgi:hypothetical protein
MTMPLCPKCASEVSKTDTHCMDCGTDLMAAREKERQSLREMSQAARMGSGPTVATGAAAGTAAPGERSSDETRIRAFDKQEAARLAEERKTSWVTAGICLVLGLVLLGVGFSRVKTCGGFGAVGSELTLSNLRELGFGMYANAGVLAVLLLGMGLASVLVGVGQARLAMATTRAMNDVRSNVKPEIVHVSTLTILGLFALAVFCPPLGRVVGAIFFFGRNPDMKGVGGTMAMISLGIAAALGINELAKVAANMKGGGKAG